MTNPTLTHLTLVLDRSGSMESVKEATVASFNQFLKSQQETEGEATLSLVQFDDQYEVVHDALDLKYVPELTAATFVPRGSTALLDAMGRAMEATGQRLARLPEQRRPGTVIFVTLTDGMENASKQYAVARINEMIRHQRDVYKWQFVFLAANQDAIATAAGMGISAGSALTLDATPEGVRGTMDALARQVTSQRRARAMPDAPAASAIEFTPEERAAAAPSSRRPGKS